MDKKTVSSIVITALLTLSLLSTFPIAVTADSVELYVNPSKSKVLVGGSFMVNVTVENVTNLYGWEFKLYYNNTMLNGTSISEGEFLNVHGDTYFESINFTDAHNATHGIVWTTCSLLGNVSGIDGSGVLATIFFECKQFGNSTLSFDYSKLGDPEGIEIQHVTASGSVETWPRNISIIDVLPSASEPYVGQIVDIAVAVGNEGNYTETFNLTAFYNNNSIETKTVAGMSPFSQTIIMFKWDTIGLVPDTNYTMKAEASMLTGETNTTDNVFVDGEVRLRNVMVNIIELTPCNQTGYPTDGFSKGSMASFKVNVNNSDMEPKSVLITVNVFDADGAATGLASIQGDIPQGSWNFTLGFKLPTTAATGNATIHASLFTNWPHAGGVPYCPGRIAEFEIRG